MSETACSLGWNAAGSTPSGTRGAGRAAAASDDAGAAALDARRTVARPKATAVRPRADMVAASEFAKTMNTVVRTEMWPGRELAR